MEYHIRHKLSHAGDFRCWCVNLLYCNPKLKESMTTSEVEVDEGEKVIKDESENAQFSFIMCSTYRFSASSSDANFNFM